MGRSESKFCNSKVIDIKQICKRLMYNKETGILLDYRAMIQDGIVAGNSMYLDTPRRWMKLHLDRAWRAKL